MPPSSQSSEIAVLQVKVSALESDVRDLKRESRELEKAIDDANQANERRMNAATRLIWAALMGGITVGAFVMGGPSVVMPIIREILK